MNEQYLNEVVRVMRNIGDDEALCPECSGWGVVMYATTSTYWGGIGGSALTRGVCDRCWGSGLADCPWPSHREFYQMKERLK